jgi:hypothetical protein
MSKIICAGCFQQIPDRRFLKCSICQEHYDLQCSNVSEARFYNTMTADRKKTWNCPKCVAQRPKLNVDNANTPIRNQTCTSNLNISITPLDTLENCTTQTETQTEISNITLRKKPSYYEYINPSDEDDILPEGNTLKINTLTSSNKIKDENTINIQQLDALLKRNLKENNENFLRQVKITIQTEIEHSLRELKLELKDKTDKIIKDQSETEKEITGLNTKIENLNLKCSMLQKDTEMLQEQINNKHNTQYIYENMENRDKIVVLHGLIYNYWESEYDLTKRISTIFHELLNINISGYIEEISYIGRKGPKRPLKIELISKKMKKYILENSDCFKNTGLNITEYYDTITLQKRRELKQALHTARQNGQHAIIRNSKLIINGRETTKLNSENDLKSARHTQTEGEKNIERISYSSLSGTASEKLYEDNMVDYNLSNPGKKNISFRK